MRYLDEILPHVATQMADAASLRSAVASAEGYAPRAPFLERTRGMLTAEGSPMNASMFRDIKAGAPVEADGR